MKRQVILDYVEIPYRIPFEGKDKAQEPPPSPGFTELVIENPRKRRKTDALRLASPTVSDFDDARIDFDTAVVFSGLSTPGTSGSSLTLDAMLPVDAKLFESDDEEVSEDEELIIPGETDAAESGRDDDTVPVRVLRNFSIYDAGNNTLLHIAQLLAVDLSTARYRASGLVGPGSAPDSNPSDDDSNDDDSNEDGAPRVKLSAILKFDVHSFSDATNTMDRMTYNEFVDTLRDDAASESALYSVAPDEDVAACLEMLGRTLTEDDIQSEDVKNYVIGSLEDICRENGIRIKSSPFLREYLKNNDFDTSEVPVSKSKVENALPKVFDKEIEVLKHRNRTTVTHMVGRIAQELFRGSLELAGSDIYDCEVATSIADTLKAHHDDPESIVWDSAPLEGQVYASVIVDGVKYSVGDDVMVNPGEDDNTDRANTSKTAASTSSNSYANRLWLMYDENATEFLDIPDQDMLTRLFEDSPPNKPCMSCGMRNQQEKLATCTDNEGPTGLFDIAQITGIDHTSKPFKVFIRYFGRLDLDERRLCLKTKIRILEDVDCIEGLCYVRQLSTDADIRRWVQHEDHFYTNQVYNGDDAELKDMDDASLRTCRQCFKERDRVLKDSKELLKKNGPISCLELFSGAGGLGTGLDMSGYVTTKWAVEFSPSAAATYAANHADATVYCQDSSTLLQHAINTGAGKRPPPLLSNQGTRLPLMPRKYEVDMISGGIFDLKFMHLSKPGSHRSHRSTLSANMLSYVEHYEPKYFLLENVGGFISHALKGTRSKTKRSIEGGIEAGMVKFVMRTLIALGYQVRCKLVQAGQYGAPQSRHRIIFWGAKRGIPIPDFPVPIYAVNKMVHRCTLPTGFLQPISRSLNPDIMHQLNPHELVAETQSDKRDRKDRRKKGIPRFRAVHEKGEPAFLVGFPEGAEYATAPKNRYQTWLRQKMEEDQLVSGHYTKTFTSRLVEATTSVPLRPGANHLDLPLALVPNHAKPGAKQAKHSFYGRVDEKSKFKCAMTSLAPNAKATWPLHPSQKRIFSVRECARAQGFPDHYEFKSVDEDKPQKVVNNQIRQIGNAVPVPLALHLGKALGKALVKLWEKKEREGSPAV
ncbi:hypothetical protein DXG03_007164 [Asterophora parasitica]|uniref:DNA (cytosine-5-)-methyltransferase n=1 Tax=Asterophora parasitica TaxID=117018 RepID=A0A9P7KDA6_9AGAR|nr:hypothetical protein DXG03_007164 [Asterophora parasitica]